MNNEKYAEFSAGSNDSGKRADKIIRQFIPDQSLGGIYKAFRKGMIRINGTRARAEQIVSEGDSIHIYRALLSGNGEKRKPECPADPRFPGQIIGEDDDYLALCKLRGQLVHGSSGSLEEKAAAYLKDRIPDSLSFRPGPLHRLDRNTTGLIFFSKSLKGAREFSRNLREGCFVKYYLALIDGKLNGEALWVDNLQRDKSKKTSSVERSGSEARTTFIPVRSNRRYTLVLARIETGRTHQIRAQAAHHGHPLSGDSKYGGSPLEGGYLLHSLTIHAPKGDKLPFGRPVRAELKENQLKRLNRIFSDCTIKGLKEDIERVLEDQ